MSNMNAESKIKVLQLVWRFNTGGAENMVVAFHNYFSHNSTIQIKTLSFTPSKGEIWEKQLQSGNVNYIPKFWGDFFPFPLRKIFRYFFYTLYRRQWLKKNIYDYNPDIVHVHLANLAAEMYDVLKGLSSNTKVIYHLHSMPETITPARQKILNKAISSHKYIPICVTSLQRKSASSIYGVPLDAFIVYNGIDINRFLDTKLSQDEINKLKFSYNIKQNQLVVGSVGRGAPVKNYPLLAKSVGEIATRKEVTLLIVGSIDDQLRKEIISSAGNANIVFTGTISNTNELYRLMDVFVLPSFYESSSIVTVEAQLSGLCCVISDTISDEVIISDGVIKVSPYTSATEWAEAIERQAYKVNTINDIERFDFEKNAQRLSNYYKSIIEYDK